MMHEYTHAWTIIDILYDDYTSIEVFVSIIKLTFKKDLCNMVYMILDDS